MPKEKDIKKEKSPKVLAVEKYDKKTARPVYLKLNSKTDADLLEHLSQITNKQGYIKSLILADMQKKLSEERPICTDYMVVLDEKEDDENEES